MSLYFAEGHNGLRTFRRYAESCAAVGQRSHREPMHGAFNYGTAARTRQRFLALLRQDLIRGALGRIPDELRDTHSGRGGATGYEFFLLWSNLDLNSVPGTSRVREAFFHASTFANRSREPAPRAGNKCLEGPSSFNRSRDRYFIGIVQVSADWKTVSKTAHGGP
jgi:hypothetical protein